MPNRHPPPPLLINFSIFFQSGHSYSNPPAIKFLEKFHPTQAFKIYNHFVLMKIILKCRGSFQPSIYSSPPSNQVCLILPGLPTIPNPLLRVWIFASHFVNREVNFITCKVILRESVNFVKQIFLNFKQIFLFWAYIFIQKWVKTHLTDLCK